MIDVAPATTMSRRSFQSEFGTPQSSTFDRLPSTALGLLCVYCVSSCPASPPEIYFMTSDCIHPYSPESSCGAHASPVTCVHASKRVHAGAASQLQCSDQHMKRIQHIQHYGTAGAHRSGHQNPDGWLEDRRPGCQPQIQYDLHTQRRISTCRPPQLTPLCCSSPILQTKCSVIMHTNV